MWLWWLFKIEIQVTKISIFLWMMTTKLFCIKFYLPAMILSTMKNNCNKHINNQLFLAWFLCYACTNQSLFLYRCWNFNVKSKLSPHLPDEKIYFCWTFNVGKAEEEWRMKWNFGVLNASCQQGKSFLFIIQISLKLADSLMTFINAMKRFSVIPCAAKHEIALLDAAVNSSCRDGNFLVFQFSLRTKKR